jgi:hypothetical protein
MTTIRKEPVQMVIAKSKEVRAREILSSTSRLGHRGTV